MGWLLRSKEIHLCLFEEVLNQANQWMKASLPMGFVPRKSATWFRSPRRYVDCRQRTAQVKGFLATQRSCADLVLPWWLTLAMVDELSDWMIPCRKGIHRLSAMCAANSSNALGCIPLSFTDYQPRTMSRSHLLGRAPTGRTCVYSHCLPAWQDRACGPTLR